MADAKPNDKDKQGDNPPPANANANPAAAGGATTVAVTGTPINPVPFGTTVPEAPPGGKFGVREVVAEDGRYAEKVRYVNAHGLPYTDDPDENLKHDVRDRRDLKPEGK